MDEVALYGGSAPWGVYEPAMAEAGYSVPGGDDALGGIAGSIETGAVRGDDVVNLSVAGRTAEEVPDSNWYRPSDYVVVTGGYYDDAWPVDAQCWAGGL